MPGPAARQVALALAFALFAPAVFAQAGALDASFGDGGRVYLTGVPGGLGGDLVIQPDGRMLVSSPSAIVRLTPEGTVDPTFGNGGYAPLPGWTSGPSSELALLEDGRFYAAAGRSTLYVKRFLADGSPDSSFSDDGIAAIPLAQGWYAADLALAVQPDGCPVLVSHLRYDDGPDLFIKAVVMRLTTDGTLDPTFWGGSFRELGAFSSYQGAHDVAVLPDGRIVVAGGLYSASQRGFLLYRLLPGGGIDPTFDDDGVVRTDVGGGAHRANALRLMPDGRVVLAGSSDFGFTVARYLPDGELDPSFRNGGVTMTPVSTTGQSGAEAVVVRPDGRVVAVGYAGLYPTVDVALVGYTEEAQLDPTFGSGGIVRTAFGVASAADYGRAAALDPLGRIVVVGYSYHDGATPPYRTVVARYLGDATTPAEPETAPAALTLTAAPNPVRGTAAVHYALPAAAAVRVSLYDALGREVAVLADGEHAAGQHEAALDATALAPGVYVLRLAAGADARVARLSVVR